MKRNSIPLGSGYNIEDIGYQNHTINSAGGIQNKAYYKNFISNSKQAIKRQCYYK